MPKRKRGSKATPLCSHCGESGHYSTTCPELAQEVLKSLSKTCSTVKLKDLLSAGSLSLKHAKKPLKTGKRKGRRFFKSSTQSGKRGRDNRKKQSPVDVQTKEFLVFIDVGNAHTIESFHKRLYI